MKHWLNPVLSLETQLSQEHDRRRAAAMGREQLKALTDRLICQLYRQEIIIEQALNRVAQLEVEKALGQPKPSRRQPDRRHFQWARELLKRG